MKKTASAKKCRGPAKPTAKTDATDSNSREGEKAALAYDAEYAQTIRKAFEDALERHARLVYDALDEGGKVHAAGLDDDGAYPPPYNLTFTAELARERAERFAHGVTRSQWESASRDEFIRRMAKREILSVETFDPERKLSRMTNERGETVEVHADRPLTDRPAVRNDFEGVTHEEQGGVYVFTRWRMPSVSVADVKLYRWEKMVEAAGLVLVGKRDEARYYLPRDVEEHRKHKAERARTRERIGREMEEDRKRKAAEREELERAAKIGRARIAYEAALAGAGVPVAPSASGDAVAHSGALKSKQRNRPLSIGKGCTFVFVRRGKTITGSDRKGYVFTFGKWAETFYTESQRTITFLEDALVAMSKRLEGKAVNEGYVPLPKGVTSRNAAAILWQGKAPPMVRSFLKFGKKGKHKGEARLEMPPAYL